MQKINNCPLCQSSDLTTNSNVIAKSSLKNYGPEEQSIWIECRDCHFIGPSIKINEHMDDKEIYENVKKIIEQWNLIAK
jgi:hypothetical protein